MKSGYDIYGSGMIFDNSHEYCEVWRREDGFNGFWVFPDWGPYPWDGKTYTGQRKEMCAHPDMPGPLYLGSQFKATAPL